MQSKKEQKIREWMKKNNCQTQAEAVTFAEAIYADIQARLEATMFQDDVLYKQAKKAIRRVTMLKLLGTEWVEVSEWIDELF